MSMPPKQPPPPPLINLVRALIEIRKRKGHDFICPACDTVMIQENGSDRCRTKDCPWDELVRVARR